ncbi:MAG: electron transfer flavoprotein alpha subunit [Pseudonocardiales bacterium]|jgi:electron transfer flavoprotein alpha subunit|nr:electron transfer flavoprotein alpha subunit [Pseudonocardiales bacterium]
MAEVLVLVDSANGTLKKSALELLTAARSLGEPSAVVIGAPGTAAPLKEKLAEYGAAKVYIAESEEIEQYLVAPKAEVLAQIARQTNPAAILVASTAENKEVAARTAFKIDSGFLADAVDISSEGKTTQSIFGGAVTVTSKVARGVPVISLRANSVAPEASAGAAEEVSVEVVLSDGAKSAKVLERVQEAKGSRPSLQDASVIVSGGRGVGSAENFSVVENVADAIGAAVGASRAATDAGWVPHQMQVGQTGVTVSPQLYIALGISGAIQHRAGMQTSKTIVAVNKDPEAPIFELADFGVVGDLFTVAPQLAEEVTKRKG